MSDQILQTKLFIPQPGPDQINRPRLLEELDQGLDTTKRLILVSAPAGYGKTTLVSSWLQSAGIKAAWISLDSEDNDFSVFITYLLETLGGQVKKNILPLLGGLQSPAPERIAVELINIITAEQKKYFLVLDDYHRISSPSVQGFIWTLLENTPPDLLLILITREDPPFNLAKLRARRQMVEIRQQDLRFNQEETNSFLARLLNKELAEDQLKILQERTEGWAVGLQLAGLSLQDCQDPYTFLQDFHGSHFYIIDYLLEEVLNKLEPSLSDFLCKISLLKSFTAGLCDAALERNDSKNLLRKAETANLFLIPLDQERKWYRFHHLMADILPAEISADERKMILKRAAHWMKDQHKETDAIYYALLAEDMDLAVELIKKEVLITMQSGKLSRALEWLKALPEKIMLENPELAVYQVYLLIMTAEINKAEKWINRLQHSLPENIPAPVTGLLTALGCWQQYAAGKSLNVQELVRAEKLIGEEFPVFRSLLAVALGQAYEFSGQYDKALQIFSEGEKLASKYEQPITALILANNRAFLLDKMGKRREAAFICRQNVEKYSSPDGQPGLLAGIPCIPLGCFLYISGEYEEARIRLVQAIHLLRRSGMYAILGAPAVRTLALILAAEEKYDEADQLLNEMKDQAGPSGLQAAMHSINYTRAELSLIKGNWEEALLWLGTLGLPENLPEEIHYSGLYLLAARVWTAAGKYQKTDDLLEKLEADIRPAGDRLKLANILAIKSLNQYLNGKSETAVKSFEEALDLAAPLDYTLPFQPATEYKPLILKFQHKVTDFTRKLLREKQYDRTQSQKLLVEEPSEREMELLRLVSTGMSNQDISSQLYISVGTVKWHLNNIYGKLGVRSRTQAAAAARELGLL